MWDCAHMLQVWVIDPDSSQPTKCVSRSMEQLAVNSQVTRVTMLYLGENTRTESGQAFLLEIHLYETLRQDRSLSHAQPVSCILEVRELHKRL